MQLTPLCFFAGAAAESPEEVHTGHGAFPAADASDGPRPAAEAARAQAIGAGAPGADYTGGRALPSRRRARSALPLPETPQGGNPNKNPELLNGKAEKQKNLYQKSCAVPQAEISNNRSEG